jgi:hypothetical protein
MSPASSGTFLTMVFFTGGPAVGTLFRLGALFGFGTAGRSSSLPTAAATAVAFTRPAPRPLLFGAAFGAEPLPLPSFRARFGGMASSGAGPVVHMIGAGFGRAVLGFIGLALGLARALDGFAGAADGAATSSICSSPATDGLGTAGSGAGRSGVGTVGTGAADGRALARGGALLVRSRLGRGCDVYRTIAAGAVGGASGAGAGSAGAGGGGGGGGGRGGAGALSYGVRLERERPRRIAPAPGAGGGGGPELTTCMSSGSFGGVAMEKWMWLCCWWWVAA